MKYEFKPSIVLGKGGEGNLVGDRFPCAVCGKSYLRKRHLQRHMRDECIGIPPRFSCELCPSRFRRKYHMVRHLTSKHNIPANIAQQAAGSGVRASGHSNSTNNSLNNNNNAQTSINLSLMGLKSEDEHHMPADNHETHLSQVENLSLRKDLFVDNASGTTTALNGHNNNGNMSASPAHSGGACSSSGTRSPLPAHLPTYGLSGAITAISTLAAEQLTTTTATATVGSENLNMDVALNEVAGVGGIKLKTEPMSPTKLVDEDKMDDDWKLKLSLQLISNSLLKERLMNTIPFGTGFNSNN